MQIYVFGSSLETLGVVSNFTSLRHTKQFGGSGSFKLVAPYSATLYGLLTEDNILYWNDNGRASAVYIESVICERDKDGEIITVSGKNLRGLLGRRIVWSNINFSGTVEAFARSIISTNCISPSATERAIPLLALETSRGLTPTIIRQTENDNLEDLLDDVSAAAAVGFDIALDTDTRGMIFICYEGTDRRTTQSATPWVVISRDRNNVISQSYTRSNDAYKNTALIGGETDETTGARREESITTGSGLSRREIFVSASGVKYEVEEGETEEQAAARYSASLIQKGSEKLANQVEVKTFECELDANVLNSLEVGDKITALEKTYNLLAQTYISEITAYYEKGERSFDVVLGSAVPTIYKKLEKGLS